MTIGEKIKNLRQKEGVTQEKLAEYLGISFQSVSKWETGTAMPDITLVVPLANFFGVTIDELFDRTAAAEQADVDEYLERSRKLRNKGIIAEDIELWREAVKKYPKNFTCLDQLANALWLTLYYTDEKKAQNAEEVVEICERILTDCTDSFIREGVIQKLVFTYSHSDLPIADEGKAEKYAWMAGGLITSREMLLEQAYFTEEGRKKSAKQRDSNTLTFMDRIDMNIQWKGTTPEERIFAIESALKLWNTVIYDGNFLFYHCRIADLYTRLSTAHADLSHRDETLENLKLAKYHADKFDNLPCGEQNFTSVFVNHATSDTAGTTKNYTSTNAQLIKNRLDSENRYDFLRDDAEFIEFMKSF